MDSSTQTCWHIYEAKKVATAGAAVLKQLQEMQWDLLQGMAQVPKKSEHE